MKDYKRKNYLINPNFQIKVSLYIVICILVATIVYPIGIWQLFQYFAKEISKFDPNIFQAIMKQRGDVLLLLSLWEIGILILVFIMCIFISHRIAGPLHKLKYYLRSLPQNKQVPKMIFRKGDYFPEIANIWNESFEKIQNIEQFGGEAIDDILAHLESLKNQLAEDQKNRVQEVIEKIIVLRK